MKKIVIKIGTNVITKDNGLLDLNVMENLVEQVAELNTKGVKVIMVSSGAMGAGRSLIKVEGKSDVVRRQVLCSVGQIKLLETYLNLFRKKNLICSQVLVTKEDFRDRTHYLNMKNCIEGLLENGVIPIINENDVISVSELMFTDNDELAGLMAALISADALVILSSVAGILDDKGNVVHEVDEKTSPEKFITGSKSAFGRGGMLTKVKMAGKIAKNGIETYIANGREKNVVTGIFNGEKIGTHFRPKSKTTNMKRWISTNEGQEKGWVKIDGGAENALKNKIASLLPVGVKEISDEFKKGDLVKIINLKNEVIGCGIANYSHKTAKNYLGKNGKKALIHYDYLYLQ
ncbi:glutamate 5-kinase [Candidatus Peregrinibacteria bacterium]|nr:glutamate 5-kinase [Candidatus Peregrinibacteria bacterium]